MLFLRLPKLFKLVEGEVVRRRKVEVWETLAKVHERFLLN